MIYKILPLLFLFIYAYSDDNYTEANKNTPLIDKIDNGLKDVGSEIHKGLGTVENKLNEAGSNFQESIGTKKRINNKPKKHSKTTPSPTETKNDKSEFQKTTTQ